MALPHLPHCIGPGSVDKPANFRVGIEIDLVGYRFDVFNIQDIVHRKPADMILTDGEGHCSTGVTPPLLLPLKETFTQEWTCLFSPLYRQDLICMLSGLYFPGFRKTHRPGSVPYRRKIRKNRSSASLCGSHSDTGKYRS